MTFSEWKKAGGTGFANSSNSTYCRDHKVTLGEMDKTDLADIVKEPGGIFQRMLVGDLLLRPKGTKPAVRAYAMALAQAEYDRHLACEHRVEHFGIACFCGCYHNPKLKASEIYGKDVALTWDVP